MTAIGDLNGFAVDLGGTKIAAAQIEDGKVTNRARSLTVGTASGDDLVDAMATLLRDVGYQRGAPLGVAVAGRTDDVGIWHAVNTATLSKVSDIPLQRLVVEKIGQATIMNDGHAAALAEARFGAGQGVTDFAFITISTGVGGGLILNGTLHHTPDGMAGHLGFAGSSCDPLDQSGDDRGTIEGTASGRAIERAAQDAGLGKLEARQVFERARTGDQKCEQIIETSSAAISDLCLDLRAILGLEAVLIGGSVGFAAGYIDRIQNRIRRHPGIFHVNVAPAALGPDGPLFGALGRRDSH